MSFRRLPGADSAAPNLRASKAIVSGFMAMFAMIVAFIIGYGISFAIAGSGIGDPLARWFDALVNNEVIALATGSLYLAIAIHFTAGLAWALVYVYLFEPRLKGQGWLRGVEFSLLPWILSLVVFLPIVGGGFFGLAIGAGPLPIIGNLILHLAYGATLGAVYAALAPTARGAGYERAAERSGQRSAAIGILVGALAGAAIGVVLAVLLIQVLGAETILGVSPWFFAIGSALIGAAWGGLIASIAGYSGRAQHEAHR